MPRAMWSHAGFFMQHVSHGTVVCALHRTVRLYRGTWLFFILHRTKGKALKGIPWVGV